jgi:hypothetical protein
VHPRERLDEGRLPGPVLAEERVHLAGQEPEVDLVERLHPGKGDGDALQFNQWSCI